MFAILSYMSMCTGVNGQSIAILNDLLRTLLVLVLFADGYWRHWWLVEQAAKVFLVRLLHTHTLSNSVVMENDNFFQVTYIGRNKRLLVCLVMCCHDLFLPIFL